MELIEIFKLILVAPWKIPDKDDKFRKEFAGKKKFGIKRVILARELNLKQIKAINFPKEVFIHGALCYSISGRCFLSQDLYKFSANRGECLQVCRRTYKLTDLETNKEIKVNNQFLLSAKDLCTLPFLDKILKYWINFERIVFNKIIF